jgi:hypothetical protein
MYALRPHGCAAAAPAATPQRSHSTACAAASPRRAVAAVRFASARCRRARPGRSGIAAPPRAGPDDDGALLWVCKFSADFAERVLLSVAAQGCRRVRT